jgi:hypothetical protein
MHGKPTLGPSKSYGIDLKRENRLKIFCVVSTSIEVDQAKNLSALEMHRAESASAKYRHGHIARADIASYGGR